MSDFDSLMKAYANSSSARAPAPEGAKRHRPSSSISIVREKRRLAETSTPLRVLVIVCAGPASLHDTWLKDAEQPPHEGLATKVTMSVVWYGQGEPEERFTKASSKVLRKQGPKWVLVRAALRELHPDWREEFDYVWLPDDDLQIASGTISQLAEIMHGFDLDLAQPCLTDRNITCPAYRPIITQAAYPRNAIFHRTNFVEIMCPMLHTKALNRVFSTIDDDRCQCGWGLDAVWPTLLAPRGVAVIDAVQVEHTRPPNAFAASASASYSNIDPRREELDLLARFKVAPYHKKVLEVVVEDANK